MDKPYIVGLTGGIACGKSTVSATLVSEGVPVADADALSHELTAPGGEALPRIAEVFGPAVFEADGTLNRHALGALVFGDEASRRALEGIIHPMVQRRVMERIREGTDRGEPLLFLDVPLLFETGMDALCDEVWVVTADEETQVRRIMQRDRLSAAEARARIESQMSTEEKAGRAQVIVKNDRGIEALQAEVRSLLRDLRRRIR